MIAGILIWASSALLFVAVATLIAGFVITSRLKRRAPSYVSELVEPLEARLEDDSVDWKSLLLLMKDTSELPHQALVQTAYFKVSKAAHQFANEETAFSDMKSAIAESFARLDNDLETTLTYSIRSNFEREPRMDETVG